MATFAAAYSFSGSGLQFRLTYVEIAGILGSWSSPKVGLYWAWQLVDTTGYIDSYGRISLRYIL